MVNRQLKQRPKRLPPFATSPCRDGRTSTSGCSAARRRRRQARTPGGQAGPAASPAARRAQVGPLPLAGRRPLSHCVAPRPCRFSHSCPRPAGILRTSLQFSYTQVPPESSPANPEMVHGNRRSPIRLRQRLGDPPEPPGEGKDGFPLDCRRRRGRLWAWGGAGWVRCRGGKRAEILRVSYAHAGGGNCGVNTSAGHVQEKKSERIVASPVAVYGRRNSDHGVRHGHSDLWRTGV